ncbi:MAG: TonB-dependent receptor [Bryobacteraceae bacterium]|nr:TonB-dependent receptor [Bryobacteraceae bacterium]MDW8378731.1 TonB-dependent receptor [Bryobacterales bacterium]
MLIVSLFGFLTFGFVAHADVRLNGKITGETGKPVPGARISLRGDGLLETAISDPTGAFQVSLPKPGRVDVEIEREGFFRLKTSLELAEGANEAQFVLSLLREVVESVDVNANPGFVDMDRTSPQVSLSGTTLLDVPYPATNTLRNALRIIPGMVQDGRGGVHLHGGAEEQTLYTLEGFQLNDPLTGRFESRLSVESVQSIDVTAGRPPAEFGKGSSGVLAVRSRTGDDRLRYSATNFVPGIEYQKSLMIGGWTPRANLSGPWKKGRAWFSDSLDLQFVNTVIRDLPRGQDRTVAWRGSNLLHNQINLTPSNILTVGSLFNLWYAPRNGLSILDPRETTVDRRSRQWFTYLKDQIYFRRGALLEFGFSYNRTYAREIPQGDGIYVVSPFGRRGNYFLDSSRRGGRDQWITNLFAPSFTFLGGHQLKAGLDLTRQFYSQSARRSGIEYTTADFTPVRRTLFYGSGQLRRSNFETSSYIQDSWRIRPRLLIEAGLRQDWDRILRNWNFSPRLGFAWSPFGLEGTKISGGFARIFDQTSLRVFSRPLDQYSASIYFGPDGDIARGPALSVYCIDNPRLASPRYHNWNLGFEHELPMSIQARVNLIQRSGTRGFTYINRLLSHPDDLPRVFDNLADPVFDAIYVLSTQRADRYRAIEVTLRQPIRQRYEWMLSYTRSRARSNAVIDQSVDEPLLISDNAGPLPWDTPNRWLSWGYLPTPWKKWAVAYLAEYRTGFPFSIQDANGQLVSKVNELRYPAFFELNLHVERTVFFRKQWWAIRGGFINLTNHRNPNVINNVLGSPNFLKAYGGQGRAFNIRIRWLGKQ